MANCGIGEERGACTYFEGGECTHFVIRGKTERCGQLVRRPDYNTKESANMALAIRAARGDYGDEPMEAGRQYLEKQEKGRILGMGI